MSFLQFHAIAAARGDGFHPKLAQLFERLATHPFENGASGPDERIEVQRKAVQSIGLASPLERGSTQLTPRRSA